MIRLFTSLTLLFLTGCATQPETPCTSTIFDLEEVVGKPAELSDVPRSNRKRQAAARRLFEENGCPEISLERLPNSQYSNVICTIPGTKPRITIGSHHDRYGGGQGVADNWTGVLIQAELIRSLMQMQVDHEIQLIAFAEEEIGLKGSEHHVRQNKDDLPRAMINIDTIGVNELSVDYRSDDDLSCVAEQLANQLSMPLRRSRLQDISGDWEPFQKAGVPVISFHSVDRRVLQSLHSYRDNVRLVKPERFDAAYRYLESYLRVLDQSF